MNRKDAIKQISILVSLAKISTWSYITNINMIAPQVNDTLESLVNAIIPDTNTPGDKLIDAQFFVARMIQDNYDTEVQQLFQSNMLRLQQASFHNWPLDKQTNYLKDIYHNGSPEQKKFVTLVKDLCVRFYMNSEYFLTNYRNYHMETPVFLGCTTI